MYSIVSSIIIVSHERLFVKSFYGILFPLIILLFQLKLTSLLGLCFNNMKPAFFLFQWVKFFQIVAVLNDIFCKQSDCLWCVLRVLKICPVMQSRWERKIKNQWLKLQSISMFCCRYLIRKLSVNDSNFYDFKIQISAWIFTNYFSVFLPIHNDFLTSIFVSEIVLKNHLFYSLFKEIFS